RLRGSETIAYPNRSPDSLQKIAIHLRQNVFAPDSPRRERAPITGGVTLERVLLNGRALTAALKAPATPGQYVVDATVMWVPLAAPLAPGDSLRLELSWSYAPPPSPSDG